MRGCRTANVEIGITDSSQHAVLDRKFLLTPMSAASHEMVTIAAVRPNTDTDLDRITDAERNAESGEDLLRTDALKE
jgi:hypothetical protein